MSRIRIQPYGASKSARIIAENLTDTGLFGRVLRLKKDGNSRYVPRTSDIIINWGSSNQRFNPDLYINKPSAVAKAANKLTTFRELEGNVRIPQFTTEVDRAMSWVENSGPVYARTKLSGNSGEGIHILTGISDSDWVFAPLYTKKVYCDKEYRVHVFRNERGEYEVFDIQEKRRRNGVEADGSIKNTSHGYVFCRQDVSMPLDVGVQAMLAAEKLGLDFCGIDMGYESDTREATLFEVNTACGIEGTTLTNYTKMLSDMVTRKMGHA